MANECVGCDENFVSVASFDAHRTGKHGVLEGPARRRCLTLEEMSAVGWERTERGWRHPKGMREHARRAVSRGRQAA